MLKVGVVGSRRRDSGSDLDRVRKAIELVLKWHNVGALWLVSGGCPKGGDRFAEVIAKERGWPITIFYPDWGGFGKSAGFVRNAKIVEESDFIIACVSSDRTGGTEDTVRKAQRLGKQVILVGQEVTNESGR